MAGSLKVTATHGQEAYAYTTTAAVTALNGATSWTIAFFYQLNSWEAGIAGNVLQIGNPPMVMSAGDPFLNIYARNADGSKTIGKTVTADTSGHHITISGDSSGISTIYIDGIVSATTTALGPLLTGNIPCYFGWSGDSHAITLYLSDIAIWGGYPASAADALALATRVSTPATLGTPATNYWTLQGTPGATATPGDLGLNDSIGSVNLNATAGAGTLVYDAHVITATPTVSVFIGQIGQDYVMPYVDTTGYLLFVPLYLNPVNTAGGPLPAYDIVTVGTPPVITVAGTPVTVTVLPHDPQCSFISYQFATRVTIGQVVTMSAPVGWASTTSGAVGGTSDNGLGSDPIVCLNHAGTSQDSVSVTPTMKVAWNIPSAGSGASAHVLRNLARLMNSCEQNNGVDRSIWHGNGAVTSLDANKMPASYTGGTSDTLMAYISSTPANNGCDSRGTPALYGTMTLIHGDATPGVDASTKVLQIDIVTLTAGWTVTLLNIVHSGDWDGTAWHKIIKTYAVTWSPSGGDINSGVLLQIRRVDSMGNPVAGGPVVIPILANGQSELGVFEPSVADPDVPVTIPSNYLDLFDPLAVSPHFLAKLAGAGAIRWMPDQILLTFSGSQPLCYPYDLDIRKSTDFFMTTYNILTMNITRVDPVSTSIPTGAVVDYINGDSTGTIPIYPTTNRFNTVLSTMTTASPHGIRTGDSYVAARPLALGIPSITLTSAIDAVQTVIPLSTVTNLAAGMILQLGGAGSEKVQFVSASSLNATVIRGVRGTTAQTNSNGNSVYPEFRAAVSDSPYITLTGDIDAVQTTIPVSAFTNINGDGSAIIFTGTVYQLGPLATDEQVEVTGGNPTSTNITVIRGTRGTTALAKTAGTVVYPAFDVNLGGANDAFIATSPTGLYVFSSVRAVPRNTSRNATLLYAQNYSPNVCPIFYQQKPAFQGTATYELCAHATSLVAAANPDGVCICWVSVPFFCTDAGITACINKMIPDFLANPGLQLIIQCDNELFNGFFYQHSLAVTFCEVAPNPENPLVHFVDWYDYTASRQNHFNMTARAAFTAAGLDPDRVVWFQGGGGNLGSVQGAIAYCQRYSLPIRSYAVSFYADMNQLSTDLQNVYVSWIPESTGVPSATATWDLATSRAVMGSNYRASIRYGGIGAITGNVTIAQYLSRYNHGVSVDGLAPANTNPVPGLLCGYEGATTQPLPWNFPAFYPGDQNSPGIFPQVGAWTTALQYDPEWYKTEWDFWLANQDGAHQFARLMGSKFPYPEDAIMEFACYFLHVSTDFPIGENQAYMYSTYRWQQQKPGYGDGSHGGVVNNLDFWNPLGGVVSLTGAIDAVQTVIPLSAIEGIIPGATLDINPDGAVQFERVLVVSIAGLDITVVRGQNSTAAAAKPSGTLVYPQVLGINQDMHANGGILPPTINESVRGQVVLDWIAALPTPTPTPTLTGDGAILLAGM